MVKYIPRVRITLALTLAAVTAYLGGCATDAGRSGNAMTAASGFAGQDTLAVLLPESGRYAGAAKAVRDGILSAHGVDRQGQQPQIRFYDSSDPASVPGLLRRAASEGATLAIGPLQKASVRALAEAGALPVPTLALNRANVENLPANLYLFALSPEDEAAEVANKAWERGYRNAVLLYPDSGWGGRISSGFRSRWGGLGGQVVAARSYAPSAENHTATVSALFADAGGPGAADFLFLVTTADKARSLWPQIQSAGGAALPTLSTSHIYRGSFDPVGDRSLVGLQFVDIPWLLSPDPSDPLSRERLQVSLSGIEGRYTRLYAMGIDAYGLAPRVTWMARNPGSYLDGRTGRLSLDTRRQVRRELILAKMDAVGPVRTAARGLPLGPDGTGEPPAGIAEAPRVASIHR